MIFTSFKDFIAAFTRCQVRFLPSWRLCKPAIQSPYDELYEFLPEISTHASRCMGQGVSWCVMLAVPMLSHTWITWDECHWEWERPGLAAIFLFGDLYLANFAARCNDNAIWEETAWLRHDSYAGMQYVCVILCFLVSYYVWKAQWAAFPKCSLEDRGWPAKPQGRKTATDCQKCSGSSHSGIASIEVQLCRVLGIDRKSSRWKFSVWWMFNEFMLITYCLVRVEMLLVCRFQMFSVSSSDIPSLFVPVPM